MSVLSAMVSTLSRNLFPFERRVTRGEQIYFRIFEVLIAAFSLRLAWQWSAYIQRLSQVIKPHGVSLYLDLSFLLGSELAYVLTGVLSLCLLIGITRRSPYAYGTAVVIMHLLYVGRHSLGKASHIANCVGMALIAFTLGTALFRRSAALLQRFVFGFLFFFLGVGYTLAGICKLAYTGIGWPNASHLALWIAETGLNEQADLGHFELSFLQRAVVDHEVLGTLSLTFGLATELTACLVWFERSRPWMLIALILMHVGILLTMNIHFAYNINLLVMLAFAPWARMIDWLLRRLKPADQMQYTSSADH
jgi:hypothetical protein